MRRFITRASGGLVAGLLLLGFPAVTLSAAGADPGDPITGASGAGRATSTALNPDAGKRVEFAGGLGDPTLGLADYSGALSLPGFIASGHAEGDMTIVADLGSVDLHLRSGTLPGFAPAAGDYTFIWTVTGGTGSFDGLKAHGTLDITLIPLFSDGPQVQELVQVVQFGDPAAAAIPGLCSMTAGDSTTNG